MKKIIILLLISSWVFKLCAQDESLPYWVSQMPTPEKGNFYYRVTHAEERTYEKAYAKAFATAILESSWKLGVEFNTNENLSEIEQGMRVCRISEDIIFDKSVYSMASCKTGKQGS